MPDIGLTHIALPVTNLERSSAFYSKYAQMKPILELKEPKTGAAALWLSDNTRPFVVVLIQAETVDGPLLPLGHLGVACESRETVDELCQLASQDRCLVEGPYDDPYPVGYWALLKDPDAHTLELSWGQEIGSAIDSNQSI
jgi:catechol 2,3-dioxygenase-like lactoylglutathione lyase family enzyme